MPASHVTARAPAGDWSSATPLAPFCPCSISTSSVRRSMKKGAFLQFATPRLCFNGGKGGFPRGRCRRLGNGVPLPLQACNSAPESERPWVGFVLCPTVAMPKHAAPEV
ncbi:predicted protein [Chaetomium globosum CBS 148.51]|uniref:Uncharacterized protein n=1 Tax=Chaetomium globosum (strain ATCC 6205 / CBS 148.51 / DSM 1962 / NBRC 6347 / NRRL 1970) TaxID=306901 RepID=Q2H1D2_CHAGB|nr:uncharacterized protein CHGG_04414 [Chaetomium globosum CBS 148.51]EAQ87795.1 predicted protein [Chaetomium globosum CBS 148.51]